MERRYNTMKKLLMWGEKPQPKKADNKGEELVMLKEFFDMRKVAVKSDHPTHK